MQQGELRYVLRRVGPAEGAQVGGDRTEPGRGQRRQLVPPRVPGLGEALAQDHQRPRALLGDVNADAVRLDDAVRRPGRLAFPRGLARPSRPRRLRARVGSQARRRWPSRRPSCSGDRGRRYRRSASCGCARWPRAQARASPSPAEAGSPPPQTSMRRVPARLGKVLLHIAAEDHYLRVHTDGGSILDLFNPGAITQGAAPPAVWETLAAELVGERRFRERPAACPGVRDDKYGS
jgi:hypothetical protein